MDRNHIISLCELKRFSLGPSEQFKVEYAIWQIIAFNWGVLFSSLSFSLFFLLPFLYLTYSFSRSSSEMPQGEQVTQSTKNSSNSQALFRVFSLFEVKLNKKHFTWIYTECIDWSFRSWNLISCDSKLAEEEKRNNNHNYQFNFFHCNFQYFTYISAQKLYTWDLKRSKLHFIYMHL